MSGLVYVLITLRVMTPDNRLEFGQILEVSVHNHHAERDEYIFVGNVLFDAAAFATVRSISSQGFNRRKCWPYNVIENLSRPPECDMIPRGGIEMHPAMDNNHEAAILARVLQSDKDDLPRYSSHTFEIDHIIAIKHNGPTTPANLALACSYCNNYKGPNIAGIDPRSGSVVRLSTRAATKGAATFDGTSPNCEAALQLDERRLPS
jgi:hypothetical protein